MIRDRIVEWVCPVCGDSGEDKPSWACLGPVATPHDPTEHIAVEYSRVANASENFDSPDKGAT